MDFADFGFGFADFGGTGVVDLDLRPIIFGSGVLRPDRVLSVSFKRLMNVLFWRGKIKGYVQNLFHNIGI